MAATTRPLAHVLRHIRHLAGEKPGQSSDAQLLDRFVRQRDDAAFAELVARHGPLVLGVAQRWLADGHEADDVVQSTFLALARQAKRLDRRKPLSGWLYTVAFRLARKAQAQSSRRTRFIVSRKDSVDPLADITGRELTRALDEELSKLPERYRVPLLLCSLDGLTRDEAAARLGLNLGALRGRLERGREMLRKRLEARGLTLPIALAGVLVADGAAALSSQLVAAVTKAALAVPVGAGIGSVKIAALAGVLLVAMGTGAGLGLRGDEKGNASIAPPTGEPPVVAVPPPRIDREGVPLPDGVISRIGSSRMRHAGSVSALSFRSDGRSIASASEDGVAVWSTETGRPIHRFPESKHTARDVRFSPDGRELIALSCGSLVDKSPSELHRIDAVAGKALSRVELAEAPQAIAPAISRSGKRLLVSRLVGQLNSAVHVYRVDTGVEVLRIPCTGRFARGVAISPGDRTIAIADLSDSIKLHDSSGSLIGTLKHEKVKFTFVEFSPDGQSIATIAADNDEKTYLVELWNVATRKPRLTLVLPKPDVSSTHHVAFAPDGRFLTTCSQAKNVILWDAANGKEVRRFPGLPTVVRSEFSPDGKVLAAASNSGAITLWDVSTGALLPASADPINGVWTLRYSRDGQHLLGNSDGIRCWNVKTGAPISRFQIPDSAQWVQSRLSPDEETVASIIGDGTVRLFQASNGREIGALRSDKRITWAGESAFTPDSRQLVVSDEESSILIFDLNSRSLVKKLPGRGEFADPLSISPDGRWLADADRYAFGKRDNSIRNWDLKTHQELHRLRPRAGVVSALAFSPNGRELVSVAGQREGEMHLWDVESGRQLKTFQGQAEPASCVAFSPDGRMLATSGNNSTIRLLEIASGGERHQIVGHKCQIDSVVFAPDGKTLAASSREAPVYIWDVLGRAESPSAAPTLAELDRAWTALADSDAKAAFAAIRRLSAASDASVAFLRDRLKPAATVDAEKFRQLIRFLDSPRFEERQKAMQDLEPLAEHIVSELRAGLAATRSAEMRRAIQRLLDRAGEFTAESLRAVRAVEILEYTATPAAREHLKVLAGGAPGARLTEAAVAAMKRLGK